MDRIGCLIFALLLCGCVSTPAIDDQQQAIAIASKACAATWEKALLKHGGTWEVKASEWHARLDGPSWKVWTGDELSPVLLVRVPRSGPPVCDLRFVD